jgi:hypothetical protein
MASSIDASTSGAGGIITTADNTGTLNLQSGGTTIATLNSSGLTMATGKKVFSEGGVLQVVQATVTGSVSTTSTTDVSSGLTASITPSSTSNKILLMVASGKAYISGGQQTIVTVYRNGSTLGAGARSTPIEGSGGSNHSLTYLDSPSSTSSVTYTIYYRSNGGNTAYFQDSSTYGQATLTLMEIKG